MPPSQHDVSTDSNSAERQHSALSDRIEDAYLHCVPRCGKELAYDWDKMSRIKRSGVSRPILAFYETALEMGWLLAELEQRFGYSLDELARRFDR